MFEFLPQVNLALSLLLAGLAGLAREETNRSALRFWALFNLVIWGFAA